MKMENHNTQQKKESVSRKALEASHHFKYIH